MKNIGVKVAMLSAMMAMVLTVGGGSWVEATAQKQQYSVSVEQWLAEHEGGFKLADALKKAVRKGRLANDDATKAYSSTHKLDNKTKLALAKQYKISRDLSQLLKNIRVAVDSAKNVEILEGGIPDDYCDGYADGYYWSCIDTCGEACNCTSLAYREWCLCRGGYFHEPSGSCWLD